jgi:hypothetical protein
MATHNISEYLNSRLIRLGIELSDVELAALQIKHMNGVSLDDALDSVNIDISDKACLNYIRDILLMPDISEGGYSVKFDRDAVVKWYNFEVQRLGLGRNPNFSLSPKVRDASNRW